MTIADIGATAPRVSAAAILWRGKVYTLPKPARHDDVIAHIIEVNGLAESEWPVIGTQGFVCDDGTFLGRRAAGRQAAYVGQIEPGRYREGDELFSEDLW